MEIIGLIPAGGTGSRMGKIPCSKEIFPVGYENGRVKVVAENLIRYYKLAGIREVFFILRKGKWDIPEYFGDGAEYGMHFGYLIMNAPFGTPFTINQAGTFVRDKIVAMGFPDIVFQPENAFEKLISRLKSSTNDLVLGLVPHQYPELVDMVVFDQDGKIKDIIIKQKRQDLRYSWFITVWNPSFTEFLHRYITERIDKQQHFISLPDNTTREIYLGDVILQAIRQGLSVDYIIFEEGHYEDIGVVNSEQ